MELSKNDLDMLHGGLAKKPLLFTLPIALSSMMQQLFSAADTAVVGLFSGDPAEIECACVRILCILFFEPVCSLYEIPAGVLRGTGRAVLPAADMMVGTCAFRIV